jgi:hypothetical protein
MPNYEVQIKPTGLSNRNLVDCLYAVVSSIQGICKKLDADGGVPLTTYEATVFTAIFNGKIENSRDETVMNHLTNGEDTFRSISPMGISYDAFAKFIVQIFQMFQKLTEQLDTDTLTDSNYEALVYTPHVPTYDPSTLNIGDLTGTERKQAVDILYLFVHMIHVLTDKLDDDGTVTDTDYEALWDTANILMLVENSRGDIAGNALTKFNP